MTAMELADLTTYALEKYNIPEEHKWNDFPGFSVLCHPVTKKWLALLMRQWDTETGTEIQKCDLRCGRKFLTQFHYPFITEPTREKGNDWLGIDFDSKTNRQIVTALFDYAYQQNTPTINSGYTFTLDSQQTDNQKVFTDTPINFANRPPQPSNNANAVPHKIREMQQLYEYNTITNFDQNKRHNFYRQGKFMEDYTDEVSWTTGFTHYFPTYHDMNVKELREYFAWRTKYRKGIVEPTSKSFAYVYIYELLNQIGTKSAAESLEKMEQFYANYIEAEYGDAPMKKNLSQWIIDFCIINNLPSDIARKYLAPTTIDRDLAIATLENPDVLPDDRIMWALSVLSKIQISKKTAAQRHADNYTRILAMVWRQARETYFTTFFGRKTTQKITPLDNAIYYDAGDLTERVYELSPARKYFFTGETWYEESYIPLPYQTPLIKDFVKTIDQKLAKYFKASKTKSNVETDNKYDAIFNAAIKDYEESLRPKIEVNLSSLSQIRSDSATTRDSLLTDEDKDWGADGSSANNWNVDIPPTAPSTDTHTTDTHTVETHTIDTHTVETHGRASLQPHPATIHTQILRALLATGDASEIIKANHLMPSVVAEQINETYYDQFADNIVDCDGETIMIVEDYREELAEMIDYNF